MIWLFKPTAARAHVFYAVDPGDEPLIRTGGARVAICGYVAKPPFVVRSNVVGSGEPAGCATCNSILRSRGKGIAA